MNEPPPPPPINRVVVAHRIVQAGLFLTLTWKWSYFVGASRVYGTIVLDDPFFPAWLQSAWTVRIAFVAAVAACSLNLVTASRNLQRACAWISLISATVLCMHQASYNDMTFVTAWWTSVWALWYVHRLDDEDQDLLLSRAAFLSRSIISMILLGGAIGKWTPEYWSGEVLYDIYFIDRDFWLFNALRATFEQDTLREIAKWYSRHVIATETIAGAFLWLLPPKWAAAAAMTIQAVFMKTMFFMAF